MGLARQLSSTKILVEINREGCGENDYAKSLAHDVESEEGRVYCYKKGCDW